jgi:hypothetical protein
MTEAFRTGFGEHKTLSGHICHFGERNSGIRTAADALAVGIADGERCLLVGDQQFARSVLRQLDSRTIDASNGTDKGVVIHLTGQDNGIALLGSIMYHIETRSHNGVRVVDCPAWGRKGWPRLNDLLAFECVMDEIARRYRALYLCIYDERVAPPIAMHPHPKIIVNGRVADNPSYVPSAQFRQHLRVKGPAKRSW